MRALLHIVPQFFSLQVVNIDVQIFESNVRVALTSFNWPGGGKASFRHWRGRGKPVIPVLGPNWYRGRTH